MGTGMGLIESTHGLPVSNTRHVDVNGMGSLVDALAGEALHTRVISRVESDPLGWEIHPVTHRDVEARDLAPILDVPLRHVGGFVIVIANELLKA
jgi:hypothetical protein